MKVYLKFCLVMILSFTKFTSCSLESGSLSLEALSGLEELEVDVTTTDGISQGTIFAALESMQIVIAQYITDVKGPVVSVFPESFLNDFVLLITEGVSLTDDATLNELEIDSQSLISSNPAVLLKSSTGEDPLLPMLLKMPKTALQLLESDDENIAVIYRINMKDQGNFTGVIGFSDLLIENNQVILDAPNFGIYQVISTTSALETSSRLATDSTIQSNAEYISALKAEAQDEEEVAEEKAEVVEEEEEEEEEVVVVNNPSVPVVSTPAPGAFQILSPNFYTKNRTPTVTWSASSNVDTYDLKIATNEACTTESQSYEDLTSVTKALSSLSDGVYYICVSAVNETGTTAASNTGYKFVETQMIVLGQADSSSKSTNSPNASLGMDSPADIAVSGSKLVVSDGDNNRVLIWNSLPTTTQQAPDKVLGQPDMTSVSDESVSSQTFNIWDYGRVATDGTKIVVLDSDFTRALIWNAFPTTNGQAADLVLGQSDFDSATANSGGISAKSLKYPIGMHYDGGRLIIADLIYNGRVLIWDDLPTSDFSNSDLVLGQDDFVSSDTIAISDNSFAKSSQQNANVYSTETQLFVVDSANNRVLIWNSIPTSNNEDADVVVGQSDFTSNSSGTSSTTLKTPAAVAVYGTKLYVLDKENDRILVWNTIPTSNGEAADEVIGPDDMTSDNGDCSDLTGFCSPRGLAVDESALYIADENNNRVLIIPHE